MKNIAICVGLVEVMMDLLKVQWPSQSLSMVKL